MNHPIPSVPTGDSFLGLLGLAVDDPRVAASLAQFAHGMQPELDPTDPSKLVDWVRVNEIGLEYGFEDEAYVLAYDPDRRRNGPLICTQLYFYNETDRMKPFPFPLPFGLVFEDDRRTVQQKLVQYQSVHRTYVRDFWALPDFNLVVSYYPQTGKLESVFCYVRYAAWPLKDGQAELAARFPPDRFRSLFGLRWSSEELRTELAPFNYEAALPGVRTEHTADFIVSHGLSLKFSGAYRVPAADQSAPASFVLAGVEFYSSRYEDAREWAGELPLGLKFNDTPKQARDKVGQKPAESGERRLDGTVVFHLPEFTLLVLYSTLENTVVSVTMYAPGYWGTTGAPAA